jgi:N6-adenosine-specific RNA methylase IME4
MKYKTIVIDPPWQLEPLSKQIADSKQYCQGSPYKTMSDIELSSFPLDNFADSECDLFIWTTHSKIPFALKLLQQWGFKYHALLTWDKRGGPCMHGFCRRTEFVVYGFKGKLGIDTSEGKYIPTLFSSKANGHSKKPDIFYSIIVKRTQEPRIDIFARRRHLGFDAYGDQVEKQIELPLFALNHSK